ncbi:MAG: GspH/FimT family pseudopilin, partial [Pseudomonadota bacterium]
AARLVALMELAHEEAALQGREYGIRFGRDDYAFLDYDPATGAWLELTDDDLFHSRQLPEDTTFELWLEERAILLNEDANSVVDDDERGDDDDDSDVAVAQPPHIALLSSGETTPFVLRLDRAFAPDTITVRGDAYGGFERETGDVATP